MGKVDRRWGVGHWGLMSKMKELGFNVMWERGGGGGGGGVGSWGGGGWGGGGGGGGGSGLQILESVGDSPGWTCGRPMGPIIIVSAL